MSAAWAWWGAALTILILVAYEAVLLVVQARAPHRLARSAHANLRQEWFAALSRHPGSEIIAVQTLRNSLMSATMSASTAALGLIGAVTLAAPSLQASALAVETGASPFTPRLMLELVLMAILFASLVCSAMAVRYFNHAGYVGSMPVGSEERARWNHTGRMSLRRAGLLYSWGLRHLMMVAPILAALLHPVAGPVAAVIMVLALLVFDRALGS